MAIIRLGNMKTLLCLVLVFGLAWLPTLLVQAEGGNWLMSTLPAWKQVGGTNFKQAALVWMKFVFGRISLTNKLVYYSLVGLSSLPFVYLLTKASKKGKKILFSPDRTRIPKLPETGRPWSCQNHRECKPSD